VNVAYAYDEMGHDSPREKGMTAGAGAVMVSPVKVQA
jgi:hypothetical protein